MKSLAQEQWIVLCELHVLFIKWFELLEEVMCFHKAYVIEWILYSGKAQLPTVRNSLVFKVPNLSNAWECELMYQRKERNLHKELKQIVFKEMHPLVKLSQQSLGWLEFTVKRKSHMLLAFLKIFLLYISGINLLPQIYCRQILGAIVITNTFEITKTSAWFPVSIIKMHCT